MKMKEENEKNLRAKSNVLIHNIFLNVDKKNKKNFLVRRNYF